MEVLQVGVIMFGLEWKRRVETCPSVYTAGVSSEVGNMSQVVVMPEFLMERRVGICLLSLSPPDTSNCFQHWRGWSGLVPP